MTERGFGGVEIPGIDVERGDTIEHGHERGVFGTEALFDDHDGTAEIGFGHGVALAIQVESGERGAIGGKVQIVHAASFFTHGNDAQRGSFGVGIARQAHAAVDAGERFEGRDEVGG